MNLKSELKELHHVGFQWALYCSDGDRSDAEEALQEAYLALLGGSARFEGRSSLKTFFFSVIRNKSRAQRKKKGFLRLLLPGSIPEPAAESGVDQLLHEEEQRNLIRRAIQKISSKQKEVLELVFYHELTIEEAADVLGMQLGTARTHYARAKEALRRHLREGEMRWSTITEI